MLICVIRLIFRLFLNLSPLCIKCKALCYLGIKIVGSFEFLICVPTVKLEAVLCRSCWLCELRISCYRLVCNSSSAVCFKLNGVLTYTATAACAACVVLLCVDGCVFCINLINSYLCTTA